MPHPRMPAPLAKPCLLLLAKGYWHSAVISLLLKRNATELRKIAVRTPPVVTAAVIDPYIHDEMALSLGCCRLVGLGQYETDHGNLRANRSHRHLPQLEGL